MNLKHLVPDYGLEVSIEVTTKEIIDLWCKAEYTDALIEHLQDLPYSKDETNAEILKSIRRNLAKIRKLQTKIQNDFSSYKESV